MSHPKSKHPSRNSSVSLLKCLIQNHPNIHPEIPPYLYPNLSFRILNISFSSIYPEISQILPYLYPNLIQNSKHSFFQLLSRNFLDPSISLSKSQNSKHPSKNPSMSLSKSLIQNHLNIYPEIPLYFYSNVLSKII